MDAQVKNIGVSLFVIYLFALATGCSMALSKEDRLVQAAGRDDVSQIRALLADGAKIDGLERRGLGQTALVAACSTDGTNAFIFLLNNGAGVDVPDAQGYTPLMQAVIVQGNLAKVKELIGRGANVNAVDNQGNSVLVHARAADNDLMVGELIEAGATE